MDTIAESNIDRIPVKARILFFYRKADEKWDE